MSLELFLASLLFTAGASLTVFVLLSRRLGAGRTSASPDLVALESRLADLVTDLNHVANTHVNAVENRRDELKRIIELANDRVRRLNMLLSDLEILEQRLRAAGRIADADVRETEPAQDAPLVRTAGRSRDRSESHAEIRRLAADGLAIEDIALRTKVPHNEVEMVVRRAERNRQ